MNKQSGENHSQLKAREQTCVQIIADMDSQPQAQHTSAASEEEKEQLAYLHLSRGFIPAAMWRMSASFSSGTKLGSPALGLPALGITRVGRAPVSSINTLIFDPVAERDTAGAVA